MNAFDQNFLICWLFVCAGSASIMIAAMNFDRNVVTLLSRVDVRLFDEAWMIAELIHRHPEPRYVDRSVDKVSYQFKKHVTAAMDKNPGELYEWIRNVWRSGYDVSFHILQEGIIPKDLDMFERYWIAQFANLLNVAINPQTARDSPVARDIKAALKQQIQEARRQR
jgi:hypothetical protein